MSGGEQPWPSERHATAGRASRRTCGLSLVLGNARQIPQNPSVHRNSPETTTGESGIAGTRKGASPSTGRRAFRTVNRVKSRTLCQGIRRPVIRTALGNARDRKWTSSDRCASRPEPPRVTAPRVGCQVRLNGVIPPGLVAVAVVVSAAIAVLVAVEVLALAWLVLGPVAIGVVARAITSLLSQGDLAARRDR